MTKIFVTILLVLPYQALAHGLFDNTPEGQHADPVGILFALIITLGFVIFIKIISSKKR